MDIDTILEEADFLCARLDELDWSMDYEEFGNNFYGHVAPSHSRLKDWLSTFPVEGAATGPWQQVGSFEPDPSALYLVRGTMCISVKCGAEIDDDNLAAALIKV